MSSEADENSRTKNTTKFLSMSILRSKKRKTPLSKVQNASGRSGRSFNGKHAFGRGRRTGAERNAGDPFPSDRSRVDPSDRSPAALIRSMLLNSMWRTSGDVAPWRLSGIGGAKCPGVVLWCSAHRFLFSFGV